MLELKSHLLPGEVGIQRASVRSLAPPGPRLRTPLGGAELLAGYPLRTSDGSGAVSYRQNQEEASGHGEGDDDRAIGPTVRPY